jgi:diguanylate cyclase (GGDEF)-like protein
MRKMSGKSPLIVLLASDKPALNGRLQKALAGLPFRLVTKNELCEPGEHRASAAADVIVVADGQGPKLDPATERRLLNGEIAILCVGIENDALAPMLPSGETPKEPPPATFIPADATERELALVCRLLGENARLRRRVHREHRRRGRLAHLADSDPLTGLPNRRAWQRELRRRVRQRGPGASRQCLAIVDLDFFKQVNARNGHAAGDRALVATGRALREALRTGDMVARLGGDEFGLLFDVGAEDAAGSIVERVRARVNLVVIDETTDENTTARASAGYVVFVPADGQQESFLVSSADEALRLAKSLGRDRAVAASIP